ncbi:(d)CMP kinase [Solicola gregarius]|uniref:Cytidylate kinase n=1 Tax=Solicola gregarius TaxID=2908642 RepID=A0AA46TIK9_9ACTN|nr:(d)CMP kinase [Solicola gregarius]UYM05183.1 (d)CMP kinase [Solicola gregarius]
MREDTLVVAVDGPSGSGKSSTARGVAERLGLDYLDTGAMYRAVTWALLEAGVHVDDADAVAAAAKQVVLEIGSDPSDPTIRANGADVSGPIRGPHVTAAVSAVAAVPAVREQLVAEQRAIIAGSRGIVVEGRDIASVVAPDAAVKVYLVADAEARASRRTAELGGGDVSATRADLERRDSIDSSRTASPLRRADGAQIVDTTELSLEDVIDQIVRLAKER